MVYNNISKRTCEACGSIKKDHNLLPYPIIPKEVTGCSEIMVLNTVLLCANCRKEVAEWYHDKVHKERYVKESQQFIPLSAEELSKEYELTYSAFYVHKRLIRMVEKYSKMKM